MVFVCKQLCESWKRERFREDKEELFKLETKEWTNYHNKRTNKQQEGRESEEY